VELVVRLREWAVAIPRLMRDTTVPPWTALTEYAIQRTDVIEPDLQSGKFNWWPRCHLQSNARYNHHSLNHYDMSGRICGITRMRCEYLGVCGRTWLVGHFFTMLHEYLTMIHRQYYSRIQLPVRTSNIYTGKYYLILVFKWGISLSFPVPRVILSLLGGFFLISLRSSFPFTLISGWGGSGSNKCWSSCDHRPSNHVELLGRTIDHGFPLSLARAQNLPCHSGCAVVR